MINFRHVGTEQKFSHSLDPKRSEGLRINCASVLARSVSQRVAIDSLRAI
jgi:hypothetical protein